MAAVTVYVFPSLNWPKNQTKHSVITALQLPEAKIVKTNHHKKRKLITNPDPKTLNVIFLLNFFMASSKQATPKHDQAMYISQWMTAEAGQGTRHNFHSK